VADSSQPIHAQVSTIVAAAETAAEQIRVDTERRMNERIAEGERAAENRVEAAEAEAQDIVKWAREEAERAKTEATTTALTIVSRAQDQADILRAEAEAVKTQATSEALAIVARAQDTADQAATEAAEKAREILGAARSAAGDVQAEGMELVENLRQMGDSLRSNSTRLLRDVQLIHRRMLAQIEAGGGDAGALGPIRASRTGDAEPRRPPVVDGELDVPEFIPRG
jgi:cell division septum initiation protein DivIVA